MIGWLPVLAIAVWWGIRLGTLGAVPFETGMTTGVLVHFALLVAISLVYGFQSVDHVSLIHRFKHVLKPAVLYALLASASVVAFHHGVCAELTALRKTERERFIAQSLSDDAQFLALQSQDPGLAHLDRETAKERALQSLQFQFNPTWHFTAALLMWMAAALSTALFTAILGQWLRAST